MQEWRKSIPVSIKVLQCMFFTVRRRCFTRQIHPPVDPSKLLLRLLYRGVIGAHSMMSTLKQVLLWNRMRGVWPLGLPGVGWRFDLWFGVTFKRPSSNPLLNHCRSNDPINGMSLWVIEAMRRGTTECFNGGMIKKKIVDDGTQGRLSYFVAYCQPHPKNTHTHTQIGWRRRSTYASLRVVAVRWCYLSFRFACASRHYDLLGSSV